MKKVCIFWFLLHKNMCVCIYIFGAWAYYSEGPGIDSRWCHWGFFPWFPRQNHVPWRRLNLWKWVPGISPGVKAAGAFGRRPTTVVVPKPQEIRGPNLPGTPWAISAFRGRPLFYYIYIYIYMPKIKSIFVPNPCAVIFSLETHYDIQQMSALNMVYLVLNYWLCSRTTKILRGPTAVSWGDPRYNGIYSFYYILLTGIDTWSCIGSCSQMNWPAGIN